MMEPSTVHDAKEPATPEAAPALPDRPHLRPSPPAIDDGVLRPLDPRYVQAERLSWWITIAVIGAPAFIFIVVELIGGFLEPWLRPLVFGTIAVVVGLLVLGALRLPRKTYNTTRYALSPLGVEIRRGWWWRRVINVPRTRIQHTDVIQGPLSRHFGIGSLILYTAGTQYASVQLDGLTYATAMAIRDYLLRGGDVDVA